MEKSFFFNSINGDRKYKAEDFREYFALFIGTGVFPNPSTNLQVMANNNLTVTLKKGPGWIKGASYINTDDYILSIDAPDGVLNRIDRVVLRMDTVLRKIYAYVKKGQFASFPVPQALQRDADAYEIALADIKVSKGAISIFQSDITDLRLNKDLCGIVHGTIDQVDTSTLFNQYWDWFTTKQQLYDVEFTNWSNDEKTKFNTIKQQLENEFNAWFSTIKDSLSGDVAGNLLNMINAIPIMKADANEPAELRVGDFWLKEG